MNNSFTNEINKDTTTDDEASVKNELSSDSEGLEMDSMSEAFDDDLIETREFKGKSFTIEIASGAILGGLSVLIGFMWDLYVEGLLKGPAFAPGMTWFDLLTVPILVAFFVFGIRSGLIACVIGCGAIVFYPNETYGWLAMIPKLTASLTMFVVPWVILKISGRNKGHGKNRVLKSLDYSSDALSPVGNYLFIMVITIIFRCIFAFIVNLFLVAPLFMYLFSDRSVFPTVFTQPEFFLTLVGGYTAWNVVQGTSDAIISYLIVFPTRLNKVFGIW